MSLVKNAKSKLVIQNQSDDVDENEEENESLLLQKTSVGIAWVGQACRLVIFWQSQISGFAGIENFDNFWESIGNKGKFVHLNGKKLTVFCVLKGILEFLVLSFFLKVLMNKPGVGNIQVRLV